MSNEVIWVVELAFKTQICWLVVVLPGFHWLVHNMNVLPHPARGNPDNDYSFSWEEGAVTPWLGFVWLGQIGVLQTVLGSAGHVHGTLEANVGRALSCLNDA